MEDEPRSLRFKVTLAPPRANTNSTSSRFSRSQPAPLTGNLIGAPQSAPETVVAQPVPYSNFLFAATRHSEPRAPLQELQFTSTNLLPSSALPCPHTELPQNAPSQERQARQLLPSHCIGEDSAATASLCCTHGGPSSPQDPPQRYGGGILRISELRRQGVDVLLPAMTESARRAPRSAARAAPSTSTVPSVAAVPETLPSYQTLSQIFAPNTATSESADHAHDRPLRGRGKGRGGRGSTLDVQPDGTPHEYRWYVQGGRRVLVYNNTTYKGKTAHRMWTQIKAANGVTTTRRRKAATKKAKRKKGAHSTKAARSSRPARGDRGSDVSRTQHTTLDRPLSLLYETARPTPPVTTPTVFHPIDIGDASRRPYPPPPTAAPPRKVPVKQPVRPSSDVVSLVDHRSGGYSAWQEVLQNALPRPTGPSQLPLVTRGLASMPFRASGRARAAVGGAGDREGGGALVPVMQHTPPLPVDVVEISDDEDDTHAEQHGGCGATPVALGRKRERSVKAEKGGESEGVVSDDWPIHYFSENTDSDSDCTSFTSFTSDEEDERYVQEHEKTKPEHACPEPLSDRASSRTAHAEPTVVTCDGHRMVAMEGWLYPIELLPMLSQQQQQQKSEKLPLADQAVPPLLAKARLPHAVPSWDVVGRQATGGDKECGVSGLTVVGAPNRPLSKRAANGLATGGNTVQRTGLETERYADNDVIDALGANEGMDDLFNAGDEIGGYRF